MSDNDDNENPLKIKKCDDCGHEYAYSVEHQICPHCYEITKNEQFWNPLPDYVSPWFKDEKFLSEVIKKGLESLLNEETENDAGLLSYLFDKAYKRDAENISQAIKIMENHDKLLYVAIEGLNKIKNGYLKVNGKSSGKSFKGEDCKRIAENYISDIKRLKAMMN